MCMQYELLMHVKEEIKRALLCQVYSITFLLDIHLQISDLVRPLRFDLQVTIKFLAHCCDAYVFILNTCYLLETLVCELNQRHNVMLNSPVSLQVINFDLFMFPSGSL